MAVLLSQAYAVSADISGRLFGHRRKMLAADGAGDQLRCSRYEASSAVREDVSELASVTPPSALRSEFAQ